MRNWGGIRASACIIAYNEERRIKRCLGSLTGFEETVVVIDSKTDDGTESIARGFGCRVYREDWKGFGPQKQSAVDKCSNDWVLIVDADEVLPEDTAVEISKILEHPVADAYAFPRKNFFHGKWLRRGDWWPDWQTRLVNRKKGGFTAVIHEKWRTRGVEGKIGAPIEHFCFEGYADMIETMDRYSSIIADDMFARGIRANAMTPAFHGIWMFVRIYALKLGFMDGFDGLVYSLLKAGGSFFKYAKLLELQRNRKAGAG
ncbi:MAG: glycosyltransferase family 2 protein [Nitrospiraceae bacterium]|nr:glycosyltransferase family 2 protein [Nitrospiraceae bacterium]